MSKDDSITVIERFERGQLSAYSVDEGKTYHPTVREAFAALAATRSDTPQEKEVEV